MFVSLHCAGAAVRCLTSKLPKWVEWGTWLLAFNAGGINAVGLLSLEHQSISHVTGSASWLGLAIAQGRVLSALHLAMVCMAFFGGAALSGWIIKDSTLKLGRRYSICLLIEGFLLMTALMAFKQGFLSAALWASAACGIQNAMVSTYSGAIIRTTHITGTVTDLGIALGHWLRALPVDGRRVRLHLVVVSGFLVGATGGAIAWLRWSFDALWLPVAVCFGMALAYAIYRRHHGAQQQ